jgi:hypothetical protein
MVHGAVAMVITAEQFYLQDESGGVRVSSAPYQLREGQWLELEGWLYAADSGEFRLRARAVRLLPGGPKPVPRLIPLLSALTGDFQGSLVSVRGSVLEVEFGKSFDAVSIRDERSSVRVFYPHPAHGLSAFENVFPGMQVSVTGISVPQTVDPEYDRYQVRLRRPEDLEIRPGRWGRLSPALDWVHSLLAALAGFALGSIWTLRHARPARGPAPPAPSVSPSAAVCGTPGSEPAHRR